MTNVYSYTNFSPPKTYYFTPVFRFSPLNIYFCPKNSSYLPFFSQRMFAILLLHFILVLVEKMKNNLICAFGDSVMKGIITETDLYDFGKPKYKIADESFVKRCEKNFGLKIFNFASYGSTTIQGMKYLNRHIDEIQKSDYVVFEYGGNDCDYDWKVISENPDNEYRPHTTLKDFVFNYIGLIKKVINMKTKPIMMSLPPIDSDRFFNYLSKGLNKENILKWLKGKTSNLYHWHELYNMEIFKMALHLQVPVIDITSPFLEIKNSSDYFCEDGIHPNEKGHQLIAGTIFQKYSSYLRKNK